MNKVFNINLGGVVFTIDDIAFDTLNRYINKLKAHFGNTEGAAEIIADIESRMAELLQQKQTNPTDIINERMVSEVIAVMGDVNDLDSEAKGEGEKQEQSQSNTNTGERKLRRDMKDKVLGGVCSGIGNYFGIETTLVRIAFLIAFFVFGTGGLLYLILWIIIQPGDESDSAGMRESARKKLFRDTDDKVISGVCSGIANYIGVETVWVRLAFAIAFFVFGVGFWVYVALWIAVPKAVTAAQKLQMKGDPIDVSNIEREVKNAFNTAKQNAPNVGKEMRNVGNVVLEGASGVLKVIGKLLAVVFLLVGIVGISLLAMAYIGVGKASWIKEFLVMCVDKGDILTVLKYGLLLAIGIPLLTFIITGFRILFNLNFKKGPIYSILSMLTFVGIIMLVYVTINYADSVEDKATQTSHIAITKQDTLYLKSIPREFTGKKLSINHDGSNYQFVINEEGIMQRSQTLAIRKSLSDSAYLEIKKTSRGDDKEEAMQLAEATECAVSAEGNIISLADGIFTPKTSKWKYAGVKMNLRVPIGTVLIADEGVSDMLSRSDDDLEDGKIFIMTEKGLVCLDCEDTIYKDKDGNVEIHIDGDEDTDDSDIDLRVDSTGVHISSKSKKNGKKKQVEEVNEGPIHIKVESSEEDKD